MTNEEAVAANESNAFGKSDTLGVRGEHMWGGGGLWV